MIMVDLVAQASMLGTFILTILVVKVCVGEGLSFDGCDGYMKLERDISTRHTISVRDTHTFLREPFSEYRASVSQSPPEVAQDDALSRKVDSIIIGRLPSPPSRGSFGSNLDGYCLRKSYPTSDSPMTTSPTEIFLCFGPEGTPSQIPATKSDLILESLALDSLPQLLHWPFPCPAYAPKRRFVCVCVCVCL